MSQKAKVTKLKVMHTVSKDSNGAPTIHSVVSNPPKLREPTEPKTTKTEKQAAKPKPNGETSELDHKILRALDALGGKDLSSIELAKKAGTVHSHKDAPRAPVRNAMERFEKLGYVKSERKGIKYLFSITDKGKAALTKGKDKHDPDDVPDHMLNEAHKAKQAKEAGGDPAPKPSTASPGILCPKCSTVNVLEAEYCKECGTVLRQRAETVLKAVQVAA